MAGVFFQSLEQVGLRLADPIRPIEDAHGLDIELQMRGLARQQRFPQRKRFVIRLEARQMPRQMHGGVAMAGLQLEHLAEIGLGGIVIAGALLRQSQRENMLRPPGFEIDQPLQRIHHRGRIADLAVEIGERACRLGIGGIDHAHGFVAGDRSLVHPEIGADAGGDQMAAKLGRLQNDIALDVFVGRAPILLAVIMPRQADQSLGIVAVELEQRAERVGGGIVVARAQLRPRAQKAGCGIARIFRRELVEDVAGERPLPGGKGGASLANPGCLIRCGRLGSCFHLRNRPDCLRLTCLCHRTRSEPAPFFTVDSGRALEMRLREHGRIILIATVNLQCCFAELPKIVQHTSGLEQFPNATL